MSDELDILPVEQLEDSPSTDEQTPDISEVGESSNLAPIEQVIEVYEGNQAKTDAVLRDIAQDVVALNESLEVVGDEVVEVKSALQGVESADEGDEVTYVVELSDAQWQELRDVWAQVRPTLQVCVYLALVVTLLTAALLGNRLWASFSKGWRK